MGLFCCNSIFIQQLNYQEKLHIMKKIPRDGFGWKIKLEILEWPQCTIMIFWFVNNWSCRHRSIESWNSCFAVLSSCSEVKMGNYRKDNQKFLDNKRIILFNVKTNKCIALRNRPSGHMTLHQWIKKSVVLQCDLHVY